jgi:ligand-binding sensor domain-containing protein/DNA-binding CsgD family transcriptional regulator
LKNINIETVSKFEYFNHYVDFFNLATTMFAMSLFKLNRFFLSGILILTFPFMGLSQINNIGTPFIKNYQRTDYQAGQQNWMIDQGKDGRLYFANNDGLLEFDGTKWNIHKLPNGIVARSVFVATEGKIYVGGYNEFGFFEPDSLGQLVYHSFNHLLKPEDRNFDEIWRIHNTPDGLIFQSYKQMIMIKDNKARVIKAPGNFHFSYFVNGQLLLVDLEKGILRYSMGSFFPLIGTDELKGLEIWSILPYENKLLIATAEKGIFIYDGNQLKEWKNPAAEFLRTNRVFCGITLNDDYFVFGTVLNGILFCNKEVEPVQMVNRLKGLQNNTVLCLYKDDSGNLWLGSDNGIDYIEINSPLSILSYAHGLSAGYAAKLFDGTLYLGTNQGVFFMDWNSFLSSATDTKFRLIEKTRGQQVWALQVIDDRLFCGTHNGTYLIGSAEIQKISEIQGSWTYRKIPNRENEIIGGTYSGLILLKKNGNNWNSVQKIKGFGESSRMLEIEPDGSIWMSHGFKGVYHIYLTENLDSVNRVDFYNSNNGFASDIGINVIRLKGNIYFSATDGLYAYNRSTDSFEKTEFINDLKNWKNLALLKEDPEGNVWYFDNGETGVLRLQEDGGYTDINLPFKQLKGNFIGGFEFVYPIDGQHVLFGASNGFVHYNPQNFKDYQLPFNVFINKVSLFNPDSIIYSGHINGIEPYLPSLNFRNNSLYFSFSSNNYENPGKTEYSTFLEGYDESWTGWEARNTREFTNLYEGDYTFWVKAKNIYGTETVSTSFSFKVNPPWARTKMAYLIYIIFGLILIGIVLLLIRKKINRTKQKEVKLQQEKFREREQRLQRETLEAEKEIIRLRNEKLREEMTMKDKELANSTLDMIQKNKLLNKMKKISSSTRDNELKNQVNSLTKKINKELDTEKQWEVFETHFENVHEAFLKRLKEQYTELSPRELKLCAYLRLNISSKEIAALMNISTRGVEISRYRLRKKLNLQRNENLTDFILTF